MPFGFATAEIVPTILPRNLATQIGPSPNRRLNVSGSGVVFRVGGFRVELSEFEKSVAQHRGHRFHIRGRCATDLNASTNTGHRVSLDL
jgi:hypothetical protein